MFFQINKISPQIIKTFNSNNFIGHTIRDISKSINNSFFNLLNEKSLINSFECENDSTLGAGEYSFLIYGGQYLTLYNIDGQLKKISWNTNTHDSIKQIRWSSYHRSYLIMTSRLFILLTLFSYELIPIKEIFQSNEQLQLFTCYQTDLWLVYLLSLTKKQRFVYYNLSEWERNNSTTEKCFSLDQLGLYRTDTICAIENDQNGECLGLLIAERNQNLTVGIQRRRRLIIISIYNMLPLRIVYFSGADDLYWTLTSVINRQISKTGWLLSKYFNNELTFIDNKCTNKLTCIEYKKELRNLAITIDRHYLILRTINSLDIYQID
ncbi:unnamed protein product [Rotaria sp. Silwood2]|nr:unnamed protein product [Rotaria sp. Silwood2]CAF3129373.1 unnamed protein product [Rotaria sp. Silwood2]CAF3300513.1 unnamed protein product [Rotaria sp. Silwood2]CAF3980068.1 unnamed protein product [Rotaria sp. Silwood2]